jgi:hypothetical protein
MMFLVGGLQFSFREAKEGHADATQYQALAVSISEQNLDSGVWRNDGQ